MSNQQHQKGIKYLLVSLYNGGPHGVRCLFYTNLLIIYKGGLLELVEHAEFCAPPLYISIQYMYLQTRISFNFIKLDFGSSVPTCSHP